MLSPRSCLGALSTVALSLTLLFAPAPLRAGDFYLYNPTIPGTTPVAVKLRRAFGALQQNKLPDAETGFQEAIHLDPKRVEAYIGLAEVARERKEPAQEESWLRRALEVDGGTPMAYQSWGHFMVASNRLADAEAAFRKASSLEPLSAESLIELGDVFLVANNGARAVLIYREAVARDHESFDARMGLGSALAGTNRYDAAIAEYLAAGRLRPSSPVPHFSAGLAWAAAGQRDKAIESLSQALKVDGTFKQAWISRGDVYQSKGDGTRAIADYKQALALDPKAGVVKFKIGLVYLAGGQQDDAERYFHDAVAIDPSVAAAWNDLAWMAANRKTNLDMALQWAQKAVALEPHNPDFIDTMAWVQRARNDLGGAAQTIEKFREHDHSSVLLYHLGMIDSEMGKKAEAIAALKQSLAAGDFADAEQARKLLASLNFRK